MAYLDELFAHYNNDAFLVQSRIYDTLGEFLDTRYTRITDKQYRDLDGNLCEICSGEVGRQFITEVVAYENDTHGVNYVMCVSIFKESTCTVGEAMEQRDDNTRDNLVLRYVFKNPLQAMAASLIVQTRLMELIADEDMRP